MKTGAAAAAKDRGSNLFLLKDLQILIKTTHHAPCLSYYGFFLQWLR